MRLRLRRLLSLSLSLLDLRERELLKLLRSILPTTLSCGSSSFLAMRNISVSSSPLGSVVASVGAPALGAGGWVSLAAGSGVTAVGCSEAFCFGSSFAGSALAVAGLISLGIGSLVATGAGSLAFAVSTSFGATDAGSCSLAVAFAEDLGLSTGLTSSFVALVSVAFLVSLAGSSCVVSFCLAVVALLVVLLVALLLVLLVALWVLLVLVAVALVVEPETGLLCLSSSILPTTLSCEALAAVGMSGSACSFAVAGALASVGCSLELLVSGFAVGVGSSGLALGVLLLRRNFFLALPTVSSSKVGVKSRRIRLNSSSEMRVLGLLSTSFPLS